MTATLHCADAAVANTPDPGGAGPATFAARAQNSAACLAAVSPRADADAASEAVARRAAAATFARELPPVGRDLAPTT